MKAISHHAVFARWLPISDASRLELTTCAKLRGRTGEKKVQDRINRRNSEQHLPTHYLNTLTSSSLSFSQRLSSLVFSLLNNTYKSIIAAKRSSNSHFRYFLDLSVSKLSNGPSRLDGTIHKPNTDSLLSFARTSPQLRHPNTGPTLQTSVVWRPTPD